MASTRRELRYRAGVGENPQRATVSSAGIHEARTNCTGACRRGREPAASRSGSRGHQRGWAPSGSYGCSHRRGQARAESCGGLRWQRWGSTTSNPWRQERGILRAILIQPVHTHQIRLDSIGALSSFQVLENGKEKEEQWKKEKLHGNESEHELDGIFSSKSWRWQFCEAPCWKWQITNFLQKIR